MDLNDKRAETFRTKELSPTEENRWKTEVFDMNMNPREWIARYGHNILVGDLRIYKYSDKDFENWIHQAFTALINEGLEKLWKEFLTEKEIEEVKKDSENF